MKGTARILWFALGFLCYAFTLQAEPHLVGAGRTTIDGLSVDFWYPAVQGDTPLPVHKVYDIRHRLPIKEAHKIPNRAKPFQACACYSDLPLAEPQRKRPLVIMVHGTAGFSTASLSQAISYASYGAIVLAADHPGIQLVDVLKNPLGSMMGAGHQKEDVLAILAKLRTAGAQLPSVLHQVDLSRVALIGHSAGANALGELPHQPGVKLIVSMAGGHKAHKREGVHSLFLAGEDDRIVAYDRPQKGYRESLAPKAFVGLSRAGHLAFTDICELMREEGGILSAAQKYGLQVPAIVARLGQDGCKSDQLPTDQARAITITAVQEALRAALEESPISLGNLQESYPAVDLLMVE